jgi:hypothetical protein
LRIKSLNESNYDGFLMIIVHRNRVND